MLVFNNLQNLGLTSQRDTGSRLSHHNVHFRHTSTLRKPLDSSPRLDKVLLLLIGWDPCPEAEANGPMFTASLRSSGSLNRGPTHQPFGFPQVFSRTLPGPGDYSFIPHRVPLRYLSDPCFPVHADLTLPKGSGVFLRHAPAGVGCGGGTAARSQRLSKSESNLLCLTASVNNQTVLRSLSSLSGAYSRTPRPSVSPFWMRSMPRSMTCLGTRSPINRIIS